MKQLKAMLGNYGALDEQGFWIDNIKSKCIVKVSDRFISSFMVRILLVNNIFFTLRKDFCRE